MKLFDIKQQKFIMFAGINKNLHEIYIFRIDEIHKPDFQFSQNQIHHSDFILCPSGNQDPFLPVLYCLQFEEILLISSSVMYTLEFIYYDEQIKKFKEPFFEEQDKITINSNFQLRGLAKMLSNKEIKLNVGDEETTFQNHYVVYKIDSQGNFKLTHFFNKRKTKQEEPSENVLEIQDQNNNPQSVPKNQQPGFQIQQTKQQVIGSNLSGQKTSPEQASQLFANSTPVTAQPAKIQPQFQANQIKPQEQQKSLISQSNMSESKKIEAPIQQKNEDQSVKKSQVQEEEKNMQMKQQIEIQNQLEKAINDGFKLLSKQSKTLEENQDSCQKRLKELANIKEQNDRFNKQLEEIQPQIKVKIENLNLQVWNCGKQKYQQMEFSEKIKQLKSYRPQEEIPESYELDLKAQQQIQLLESNIGKLSKISKALQQNVEMRANFQKSCGLNETPKLKPSTKSLPQNHNFKSRIASDFNALEEKQKEIQSIRSLKREVQESKLQKVDPQKILNAINQLSQNIQVRVQSFNSKNSRSSQSSHTTKNKPTFSFKNIEEIAIQESSDNDDDQSLSELQKQMKFVFNTPTISKIQQAKQLVSQEKEVQASKKSAENVISDMFQSSNIVQDKVNQEKQAEKYVPKFTTQTQNAPLEVPNSNKSISLQPNLFNSSSVPKVQQEQQQTIEKKKIEPKIPEVKSLQIKTPEVKQEEIKPAEIKKQEVKPLLSQTTPTQNEKIQPIKLQSPQKQETQNITKQQNAPVVAQEEKKDQKQQQEVQQVIPNLSLASNQSISNVVNLSLGSRPSTYMNTEKIVQEPNQQNKLQINFPGLQNSQQGFFEQPKFGQQTQIGIQNFPQINVQQVNQQKIFGQTFQTQAPTSFAALLQNNQGGNSFLNTQPQGNIVQPQAAFPVASQGLAPQGFISQGFPVSQPSFLQQPLSQGFQTSQPIGLSMPMMGQNPPQGGLNLFAMRK